MLRSRLLILLAVVPIAAVSLAAGETASACYNIDVAETPEDPADDVEACELETWFHRAETPAGNAGAATESYPTFDTSPPAGSVAEGNGGFAQGSGITNVGAPGDPAGAATFVGEFEGVIDRLDVTLHVFYNGFGSTGGPTDRHPHTAEVYLTIDGTKVLGPIERDFATTDFDDPSAGPHQVDFVITDVAALLNAYGLALDGPHTVELTMQPKYVNTNPAAIYVYDTTEVPGGIVFNPVTPDENATVIDAW